MAFIVMPRQCEGSNCIALPDWFVAVFVVVMLLATIAVVMKGRR